MCSHEKGATDSSRQLASHGTGKGQAGVGICKERGRVGLDLSHSEPGTGVRALHHNAGGEWTLDAADAVHDTGSRVSHGHGVGERDSRGTGLASCCLMYMCGCCRRRGEVSLEVV